MKKHLIQYQTCFINRDNRNPLGISFSRGLFFWIPNPTKTQQNPTKTQHFYATICNDMQRYATKIHLYQRLCNDMQRYETYFLELITRRSCGSNPISATKDKPLYSLKVELARVSCFFAKTRPKPNKNPTISKKPTKKGRENKK